MTRRLLLLRHGTADSPPAVPDLDRPLSNRGRGQALLAGDTARRLGLVPDRVVISPARRTRETWDAFLIGLGPEQGPKPQEGGTRADAEPAASNGSASNEGTGSPVSAEPKASAEADGTTVAAGSAEANRSAGIGAPGADEAAAAKGGARSDGAEAGTSPHLEWDERVEVDSRIYDNTLDDLLSVVRETPSACETVLLVGHNPAIAGLAAVLDEDGSGPAHRRLAEGFPAGALAIFEVEGDWSGLAAGGATLQDFVTRRS